MSNTSGSLNNDFLALVKNAGPHFVLITISIDVAKFAFAIIAQLFSVSLIWITLKSKSLHETFNLLILANAICCFFYMFTFAIQFVIATNGTNFFIPLRQCFPLMIVPIFCVQCQYLLFLALAIDRLMTALFPVWHMTNIQRSMENTRFYLLGLFMAISLYSVWTVSTGINYAMVENAQKLVPCSTSDPVPSYVFQVPICFNFLSLCAYLLLFLIMRQKSSTSDNFRATRKIFKSILAAFLLEFLGWFSNMLLRNILNWTQVDQMSIWYVMNAAGLLLVPSLAMLPPMLYIMSTEYGRAFRRCFGFNFPFAKTQTDSANSNTAFVPKAVGVQTIAIPAKHAQVRSRPFDNRCPKIP